VARYSRISKQEREELLAEFCEAISVLKSPEEIMNFIIDLLTRQELIMLAKRIKIAKLLIEGKDYREIEELLKVSHGTIAKVSHWLMEGGEGFRIITERTKKEKPKPPSRWDFAVEDWRKFRRTHPLYFWPQLLIEEIIKTMNKKQKDKLRRAIKKLDRKSKLYRELSRFLT
jgi:TrpR-related protein YerC/YecD